MTARLTRSQLRWLALAGVLLVSVLAYANGMRGGLVDDDQLVVRDAWNGTPISEWGWGLPQPLGHAAQRPLVTASYYLDFALFGQATTGYHVLNLLFHLGAVGLAFALFERLGLTLLGATVGAAVFAVHPVQTESVTYISGRRDVFVGFFWLLTMHLWLSARKQGRGALGLAAVASFVLGLASKEPILTLPGVLVIYEATMSPECRDGSGFRPLRDRLSAALGAMRRRGWIVAALLAIGVPYALHRSLVSQHIDTAVVGRYIGGTLGSHVMSASKAVGILLVRLVWPLRLQADYSPSDPLYATGWGDPLGWASLAAIAAGAVATLVAIARAPRAGFGLGILALALLPHTQLVRLAILTAEHYLYIPVVGFALLVAIGVERLAASRLPRALAPALAGLLVVGYAVRTHLRNPVYRDGEAFWGSVLEESPGNSRALANLGVYATVRGLGDEVRSYFERSLEADPTFDGAYSNLGAYWANVGRPDLAVPLEEQAVRLSPRASEYRLNLAIALTALGRLEEASAQLDVATSLAPKDPRVAKQRRRVAALLERERRAHEPVVPAGAGP